MDGSTESGKLAALVAALDADIAEHQQVASRVAFLIADAKRRRVAALNRIAALRDGR